MIWNAQVPTVDPLLVASHLHCWADRSRVSVQFITRRVGRYQALGLLPPATASGRFPEPRLDRLQYAHLAEPFWEIRFRHEIKPTGGKRLLFGLFADLELEFDLFFPVVGLEARVLKLAL